MSIFEANQQYKKLTKLSMISVVIQNWVILYNDYFYCWYLMCILMRKLMCSYLHKKNYMQDLKNIIKLWYCIQPPIMSCDDT